MGEIKIDLSGWDASDWGMDVEELVEIDRSAFGKIAIKLNLEGEKFDEIARKIGQEAIQAFIDLLGDGADIHLRVAKEGLIIIRDNEKGQEATRQTVVPWSRMVIEDQSDIAAIRKWLDEEEKEFADD